MTGRRPPPSEAERCTATVYVRDDYRYTGRGPGFKLHYDKRRCSRRATNEGKCWQHATGGVRPRSLRWSAPSSTRRRGAARKP